jgi:predicted ATPase
MERLEGLLLQSEQMASGVVEEALTRSLNTARRQGARLFELRTAATFARMLVEKGERSKASDLLSPVYGQFTEGFETTDLKEARELLDELG